MRLPKKRTSTKIGETPPIATINTALDAIPPAPVPPRHRTIFFITFLISLAGYLPTFARTVTLVDSGELILTCSKFGVAHPPGFPLYTLIGSIFSKIPWGSIAARISFMSALFAALTSGLVALITLEVKDLLRPYDHENHPKAKKNKGLTANDGTATIARMEQFFNLVQPVATGLSLAFSLTLWFYASVAEVYTLNLAMLAVVIYLMLLWHKRWIATRSTGLVERAQESGSLWLIPLAAMGYGLALGVHHVTILLAFPAILFLVLRTAGKNFLFTRAVALAFITVALGLAVYLYLPFAAARQPILNWGNPINFERFYWHISAKQYQVNLFSVDGEQLKHQIDYFFTLLIRQFTLLGLIFSTVGFVALWRRGRTIFWFLTLILLFDVAYSLVYDIAEDKDAYYLTTNLALTITLGVGLIHLFDWAKKRDKSFVIIVLVGILILPGLNYGLHYVQNNKRNYLIARDFVENTLRGVEPHGLLLTLEWQFYSPYLYMRHLEGFRQDAIVVDVNLMRRTWYVDGYLPREYPEMMQACATEKAAFLEQLYLFEADKPYDVKLINERFLALIDAFIKFNMNKGAAYLTLPMEPGVGGGYTWVPQGLTMRLFNDKNFHPENPNLELRGLFDGSVYLDEVAKGKVARIYASMYANRGRYLTAAKQLNEALEMLRISIDIDDQFDRGYEFLGDLYALQGKNNEAMNAYQAAIARNPNNESAKQRLNGIPPK